MYSGGVSLTGSRAFAVDAGLPSVVAHELAARVEAAGFAALWTTDTPVNDGLETLAEFARGSRDLKLGLGVAPVDRRSAAVIAARVRELNLDPGRILLGIGSGASRQPTRLIREAVPQLRSLLPGVPIVVAAMGPGLAALAGQLADGVLLNWLTPHRVEEYRQIVASDHTEIMMYVRTALDPGGRERVSKEAEYYARNRKAYFAANGVEPAEVGVAGSPAEIRLQLDHYDAVLDQVIVRALPASTLPADLFAIVDAAAPKD